MLANYTAQVRFGGTNGTWQPAGTWVLPGELSSLSVTSPNGQNLTGTMLQFGGSGGLDVQLTLRQEGTPNQYAAETRWGGNSGQWQPAGTWSFGSGTIVQLSLTSTDGNGGTLGGGIAHAGEGALDVEAQLASS
jgi:hypothetical protein